MVYLGWKAFGIEPWFDWKQIEDLLALALAGLTGESSLEVPDGMTAADLQDAPQARGFPTVAITGPTLIA